MTKQTKLERFSNIDTSRLYKKNSIQFNKYFPQQMLTYLVYVTCADYVKHTDFNPIDLLSDLSSRVDVRLCKCNDNYISLLFVIQQSPNYYNIVLCCIVLEHDTELHVKNTIP